jgi:hypothetical protein
VFGKDGLVKDAVVLKNPKLEGDKLTFNVQTLKGDFPARMVGPLSLHRYHRSAVHADIVRRRGRAARHSELPCMPVPLRLTRPPTPGMLAAIIRTHLSSCMLHIRLSCCKFE